MSNPLVAIVGRPNVGKSTLANRLSGKQKAIVDETAGVTRDRNYLDVEWGGRIFTVIDTGGLEFADIPFAQEIREQVAFAIAEADLLIFLVDGPAGPSGADFEIADMLRQNDKPVILVVNKVDNPDDMTTPLEFYSLGLGEPKSISSIHGTGSGDLLDDIIAQLPEHATVCEEDTAIKVAIIGRPNVGKSTLFNRLIGAERAIVTDIPGTTRDAIDTRVSSNGTEYLFIDTAGMRRKSKVARGVEYFTNIRTIRAIDRADIVLLVIDATEGITDQDQKLAELATSSGCAIIILMNKWDAIDKDSDIAKGIEDEIEYQLGFASHAPSLTLSGLTGQRVGRIFNLIDEVFAQYDRRISTRELMSLVKQLTDTGHTVTKGRQTLRLSYAVQSRTRPPEFVFFVNHPQLVEENYRRYIENRLRQQFGLAGTPLRIYFRKKV